MSRGNVSPEILIAQVKKRPALYDCRSTSRYYEQRKQLWEEIGEELYKQDWGSYTSSEKEALIKDLQVRWKSFRDTYNKIKKTEESGGSAKGKRKYIFYNQLQFLDRYLTRRRNTVVLQDQVDQTSSDMDTHLYKGDNLKDEDVFESSSTVVREDVQLNETGGGTGGSGGPSGNDRIAELLQEVVAMQKEERNDDRMGNKKFLLSLLPFLEKLPDDVNLEVRLQLMSVIQTYSSGESFMKIS